MPPLNLRRADAAARRAAEHLGRRSMPAPYPDDPLREQAERTGDRAKAVVVNTADGARKLLRQAVGLEADAIQAQAAAVEALRFCGAAGASWTEIGDELGISMQAAHRRYKDLEAPLPQRSLDDELEAA